LEGHLSFDDAVRHTQRDTRHYAKRQFTWFRHSLEGWNFLSPNQDTNRWDIHDLLETFPIC
jgi:tRNA dimethylallyltransferase